MLAQTVVQLQPAVTVTCPVITVQHSHQHGSIMRATLCHSKLDSLEVLMTVTMITVRYWRAEHDKQDQQICHC
jgi:hypothetical protein